MAPRDDPVDVANVRLGAPRAERPSAPAAPPGRVGPNLASDEAFLRELCVILKSLDRPAVQNTRLRRLPMGPDSPTEALGPDAPGLRALLVETVRRRHVLAAEAHLVSESRYFMGFGSQWRDLLDDVRDALKGRGHRVCKVPPGGHEFPVVRDCLVYVWRVPSHQDAVSEFASSPTRRNTFATAPPDPTLWEPNLQEQQDSGQWATHESEVRPILESIADTMPLILVLVHSTPRQLQSIEWAVAKLDGDGKVELRGREEVWEPEPVANGDSPGVEAFDSGSPVRPNLQLREEEGLEPNA